MRKARLVKVFTVSVFASVLVSCGGESPSITLPQPDESLQQEVATATPALSEESTINNISGAESVSISAEPAPDVDSSNDVTDPEPLPEESEAQPRTETYANEEVALIVSTADLDEDGIPDHEDNDVDGDGVTNTSDPDDDNDGVKDYEDDLMFNPDESVDLDRDGIGDNADTDDDSDGVADGDDLAPGNQLCSTASDFSDTGVCLIDLIKDELHRAVIDDTQVAYIPYEQAIHRVDLKTKSFLSPISSFDGSEITILRFDETEKRLVAGYSSGLVTTIGRNHEQHIFAQLGGRVGTIISTPQWIITNAYPFDHPHTRLFDKQGQYINNWSIGGSETHTAQWVESKQTLIWFDYASSYWDTIIQSRSISSDNLPTTESKTIEKIVSSTPYAVKTDGSIIATGTRNLFDGSTLEKIGTLPDSDAMIRALHWTKENGLVVQSSYVLDDEFYRLYGQWTHVFQLEQLDDDFESQNARVIEGESKIFQCNESDCSFMYERDSVIWMGQYGLK